VTGEYYENAFIRHIYGNVITDIIYSIVATSDIKCTKSSGTIDWLTLSGRDTRFMIRSSSSRVKHDINVDMELVNN
jgi:hypothetical protein